MDGGDRGERTGNALLRRFPPSAFARIEADCEPVTLSAGAMLCTAETRIEHVHFPTRGRISLVKTLNDGETIEIAVVGREGLVGLDALLAHERACCDAVAETPGSAIRVPAAALREAMAACPGLNDLVLDYVTAMMNHMAQAAACNRLHTVEQRCCRWLLASADNSDGDVVAFTHETLAMRLGVRRPGLTTTLGRLQRAGLIAQHRGGITIIDRPGLLATACECYETVREHYRRIMQPTQEESGAA
jgi:CRP-like cAMP-binding protein